MSQAKQVISSLWPHVCYVHNAASSGCVAIATNDVDPERRKLHLFMSDGADRSTRWLLDTLANNLLEGDNKKKKKGKMKQHEQAARNYHRRIWPGDEPEHILMKTVRKDQDSNEITLVASSVSTRLLLSFTAFNLSYSKRSPGIRFRAYEVLKSLLCQLAAAGCELQFLVWDSEGNGYFEPQVLEAGGFCQPWRQEFFNYFLAMAWATDLQSAEAPWVTSPHTRVHVADFIGFSLDFPKYLNRKVNANLKWAKQCLERSALGLLQQLDSHIDRHMRAISKPLHDHPFSTRRKKNQRMNKASKWNLVAAAMTFIFDGEDACQHHVPTVCLP